MTILVTGIFGFLGSSLAEELARENNVIGLYNLNIRPSSNEKIIYYNDLAKINETPDVIVMCHAAVSSGNIELQNDLLFNANVLFTEKILNKFPNVKVIYISSVSVFGNEGRLVSEDTKIHPENAYAISKYWAENIVLQNDSNKIIRLSSVYGIGMKENTLLPHYVNQALDSNTIKVWGNGERLQNYINVLDVISLVKNAINTKKKKSFPFLGVSVIEYSNKELAEIIAKLTNSRIEFILNDNSTSFRYNNEVTRKTLNWQPCVELSEGIKRYIEWKKEQ